MLKKQNKTLGQLVWGVIVIGVIAGMFIYGFVQKNKIQTNATNQNFSNQEDNASTIAYDGQDGKDALTLLKEKYSIESTQSDFGAFVSSINGIKAEDNINFWALYVNDVMATQAADKTITKTTDKIEWRLDPITTY